MYIHSAGSMQLNTIYCIYSSQPATAMSCMAGGGYVFYNWGRRCLVQLGTEISCMAGDGDVLYGQRR